MHHAVDLFVSPRRRHACCGSVKPGRNNVDIPPAVASVCYIIIERGQMEKASLLCIVYDVEHHVKSTEPMPILAMPYLKPKKFLVRTHVLSTRFGEPIYQHYYFIEATLGYNSNLNVCCVFWSKAYHITSTERRQMYVLEGVLSPYHAHKGTSCDEGSTLWPATGLIDRGLLAEKHPKPLEPRMCVTV